MTRVVEEEQGAGEAELDDGEMRAIDFGLGRGYSGSQVLHLRNHNHYQQSPNDHVQAARHMAGIFQANFSGGPG